MERANEGFLVSERRAHDGDGAGETRRARLALRPRSNQTERGEARQGGPRRTLAVINVGAKEASQTHRSAHNADENSSTAANGARRNELIRRNIIGPRGALRGGRLRLRRAGGAEDRAFALLHEATSDHGGGVFLEPKVEQFGDLLTEIGSVSEARELVGLQGIAGSGEKEFPRSLGTEFGHGDLREGAERKYELHNSSRVIRAASSSVITGLWKSVEKKENALRCCSGCAGDYEDPDRRAWEEDEEEEVEETKEVEEVDEREEVKEPKERTK